MGRLIIALLCALGCHGLLLFLPVAEPEVVVVQPAGKTPITIHLNAVIPAQVKPEPAPRKSPVPVTPKKRKKNPATSRPDKASPPRPDHERSQSSVIPASSQQPKDTSGSPPALVKAIPLYQSNPTPVYPPLARRRGQQGTVMLKVTVSSKGRVKQVLLYASSGFDLLDKSALVTVKNWQFIPGTESDRSVTTEVLVPVHFKLQ
jgi:protein TonB